MADHKKTAIVVVFSLAVVMVLVLLAWKRPLPAPSTEAPVLTRAPEGQFVSSLPREFILDSSAAPKESRTVTLGDEKVQTTENYTIDYGDEGVQSTGNYESQKSLSALASAYEKFLNDNGWTIINKTTYPSSRGFYGSKGNQDISIAIIDRGGKRDVSVSYFDRPGK
ncbi:MAG: hypothetical protein AAB897_04020 [Patescibacteria group bacterium]